MLVFILLLTEKNHSGTERLIEKEKKGKFAETLQIKNQPLWIPFLMIAKRSEDLRST